MYQSGKLRYVNELTGAFVLLGVLLALLGLFFVAGAQHWFADRKLLWVQLPPDGAHGLLAEAQVEMLGTRAGRVRQIVIDEKGGMRAKTEIDPDFFRLIRQDSEVIIRQSVSLVGGVFVEIKPGKGAPLKGEEPVLAATAEKDLKTVAKEILASVERATLPTLQEYTALAAELRDPEGPVQQLVMHASSIAAKLDKGQGSLGQLLNDRQLALQLQRTLDRLEDSLEQVQQVLATAQDSAATLGRVVDETGNRLERLPAVLEKTDAVLADIKKTTEQLPAISRHLDADLVALPELLRQSRATLYQIERLTRGVQRHWLIRDYMEPAPAGLTIPVEQVDMDGRRP
ncbi:MAG: hypothetical protein Tsb0017_24750 [Geothermobacteraceae bacterium]